MFFQISWPNFELHKINQLDLKLNNKIMINLNKKIY